MKYKTSSLCLLFFSGVLLTNTITWAEQMEGSANSNVTSGEKAEIQAFQRAWNILRNEPERDENGPSTELEERKLTAYFELIDRITKSVDPNFNELKKPSINVSIPDHPYYTAGTNPESIKDVTVRKKYEAAILENNTYAEYYNKQSQLSTLLNSVEEELNAFLVRSFPAEREDFVSKAAEKALGKDASKRLLKNYRDHFKK